MIRDVAIGEVPAIFTSRSPLYATSALFAAVTMVVAQGYLLAQVAMLLATIVGASLALVSRWRQWRLPHDAGDAVTMTRSQLGDLIRRTERLATAAERRRAKRQDEPADPNGEADPTGAADPNGEVEPTAETEPTDPAEPTEEQDPGLTDDS